MHAGEMKKGRGQRANGGKIPATSVETPKLAEKQNEKCTPVRRRKAKASVHTEAKSLPSQSKRPSRRRNGKKNARRRDEERQRPACTRREIARRHRRDAQAGGETGRKMHAGEARKGRGQRAKGGKIPATSVETPKLAEKQNEKCTPVRRRKAGQRANGGKIPATSVETPKPEEKREEKCTPARRGKAEASVHTEGKSPPSQSKRPSWRRNRMKNARR